jgi:hypothetical protein
MGNRRVARLLRARDNALEIPVRAGSKIPTGVNKYLVGSFVITKRLIGRDMKLMVDNGGSPLFLRGGSTVRCP